MSNLYTYYVYDNGTAAHEDDVTENNPHDTKNYTVHKVPEEIFRLIHNNAVGSACHALDKVFIE